MAVMMAAIEKMKNQFTDGQMRIDGNNAVYSGVDISDVYQNTWFI
ncbi:hypothetical protein SAMN02910292_02488 [Lachnospiraceae bacterium XBB2008]|nr:hypothetical protein SAMN02910292_02488 [Lachnospiraceae bacterium XBB2008]